MGLRNPAAMATRLVGCPTRLGVIICTTSKNNHDTATPFNNTGNALKGKLLVVQPDAACYINAVTANNGTAATTDLKLDAGEKFYIQMGEDHGWLACIAVSGTVNLQVYELR